MQTNLSRTAALLIGLISSGTLWAAPIHYDEAIDGDLVREYGQVHTVFNLGAGVHTVSGQYGYRLNDVGGYLPLDWDAFSFTLDPGRKLTGIHVELWDAGDQISFTSWQLMVGSLVPLEGVELASWLELPSPGADFQGIFGAGPGQYSFHMNGLSFKQHPLGVEKVGNYRISLVVRNEVEHQVPLPGSLALTALGLSAGLLVQMHRRRQRLS